MYTPSSTQHSTDTFSKPGLPDQSQNTEEKDFQGNTGCPKKIYTLFWWAVAPLNFELGIKVGGVLESSGSWL